VARAWPQRPDLRALSVVALLGAAFGAFLGWATYWAMCESESGGSTMCPNNEPTLTMNAQLYGGYAGLIPAAVVAYFAFRGSRTAAKVALAVGLVYWVAWLFVNDASIHGWNDHMTLL
jgi:hypothetical protein